MVLKCKMCDLTSENIDLYAKHVRLHRKDNHFECPIGDCSVIFMSFVAFKTHLRQRHIGRKRQVQIQCPDLSCNFGCTEFKTLTKHVMRHISEGHPVFCPLKCRTGKPFTTTNSLKIHNMYYHRRITVQKEIPKSHLPQAEEECPEAFGHDQLPESSTTANVEEEIEEEEDNLMEELIEVRKSMEIVFGALFLKLVSKNHVTDVVIQEIVEAMEEATSVAKKHLRLKCDKIAEEINLSNDAKGKLVQWMCFDNLFDNLFGPGGKFRSTHIRKKFYQENFSYISPSLVELQRDRDHNNCFYYYVPILETLSSMLNDSKIYNAIFRDKLSVAGYMTDYTDGLKYKNSSFFGKKTINLFIYQDAAEAVVNAIGNATGRHKLECVYMVIGNLDPHLRSLTENVQLVLLCKTKDFAYFGADKVLRRLIEDLKTLEESGIIVQGGGFEERVYGSVFITMNDNLGAHQLAGLTENFSRSSFFCRFCYITHQAFQANCFTIANQRTPQSNNHDIAIQ